MGEKLRIEVRSSGLLVRSSGFRVRSSGLEREAQGYGEKLRVRVIYIIHNF
ncbi:hypothetical protein [Bacillus sp. JCM 19041]|uniref:hypothetical protein n=1 Tax=Bacillus sp. JCM 19041 TaxID=1460637 RepID=UPI0012E27154